MGKGARIREERNIFGRQFPYEKKFTREQIADVLAVQAQILEASRDALTTKGAIMGIDEASLQMLALHQALAGVRVVPDEALIVARLRPSEHAGFMDAREWLPKQDYTEQMERDDSQAQADALAARIDEEVDPEVAKLLAKTFADRAKEVERSLRDDTAGKAKFLRENPHYFGDGS